MHVLSAHPRLKIVPKVVEMTTRSLLLLLLAPLCVANERLHKYNVGERVNLWVNRVGPYHNPQEVSAPLRENRFYLRTPHIISNVSLRQRPTTTTSCRSATLIWGSKRRRRA